MHTHKIAHKQNFKEFGDSKKFLAFLQSCGELKIIDEPLDIYLEIPHLAYLEVKKKYGKALLFTHPIDKKNNRSFDIPVLMNVFGSFSRLDSIVQRPIAEITESIQSLLKFAPKKDLKSKFLQLKELFALRKVFPKYHHFGMPPCQERIQSTPDLYELPILTTWPGDIAPFITMGQVYTQSLDGTQKNLGMYRLQVYDKSHLGLHWQIHKDSNHFFHQYKKAGKKMPVSIALGGDPLYIWCAQAPLPLGIYELLLYGFLRGKNPRVCKCLTNELYIPIDVDIVIEGFVDPQRMELEGPFGDHTGFYTSQEPYPVLEVSAITMKNSPIFPASVVGKPPLEDKYMGYLTERIFLPLLQSTTHGLLDYHMPENGVFHNLIFAKIAPEYPAHAMQLMHAFWGVGQMSFVKHAIFVDWDAPDLQDYESLAHYILNRFSTDNLLISEGVCDALDHASPSFAVGGKLGVCAIGKEITRSSLILHSDSELLTLVEQKFGFVKDLKQYCIATINPLCMLAVQKSDTSLKELIQAVALGELARALRIVFLLDFAKNDLHNPYMLTWRIVNSIDAKRDIWVQENVVFVDASDKAAMDNHYRQWPKETDCSPEVIQKLRELGLLEDIHDGFLKFFQIESSSR